MRGLGWASGAVLLCAAGWAAGGAAAFQRPAEVDAKLAWWQDQKLGLLLHWGTYTQWGIVESWSLCPEDEDWTKRRGPHAGDYFEYKRAYEALQGQFNPAAFDPDQWAQAAQAAGMRYVVFTTKHHDGFCLFDTKQTTYKVTDPACPFSANPKADISAEVFRAFKSRGMGTGAYFSKPDWHCPDYWWPYFPPLDRNPNYDPARYPERWEAFKSFTHKQIEELMTGYGPIDILWLDGGWVQPMTATSPRWGSRPMHQDIDMPRLAAMARSHQPGLIIVDRAVEGDYQDYHTPEQEVPEHPLDTPWETCMTMATSWTHVPGDTYKPLEQLIHTWVEIVAKGGNLLLGVGPQPDGRLPEPALERMRGLGEWTAVCGPALYGTRPVAPWQEGRLCYTRAADGAIHAILLAEAGQTAPPAQLEIPSFQPRAGSKITLLGSQIPLEWMPKGRGCVVQLPAELREHPPCAHAWAFRLDPAAS